MRNRFLNLTLIAVLAIAPAAQGAPHMASLTGKPAPDFTLPSDRGGDVRLSDFRGKKNVLLAFFPKAFTGA